MLILEVHLIQRKILKYTDSQCFTLILHNCHVSFVLELRSIMWLRICAPHVRVPVWTYPYTIDPFYLPTLMLGL